MSGAGSDPGTRSGVRAGSPEAGVGSLQSARGLPLSPLIPVECPRQFWGPDCKELCICHPHGQCEDVTGQCTCHARRWGARCEHACQCQHGACHPRSGACRCEPGWWGAQCSSACYCSATSRCDPQTGACLCHAGWWGRSCNNQCACNTSPCEQQSGRCQCRERTFGARCERYCQCFRGRCHPVDGTCACEPGFRGKYCRETCPAGSYGLGCRRRWARAPAVGEGGGRAGRQRRRGFGGSGPRLASHPFLPQMRSVQGPAAMHGDGRSLCDLRARLERHQMRPALRHGLLRRGLQPPLPALSRRARLQPRHRQVHALQCGLDRRPVSTLCHNRSQSHGPTAPPPLMALCGGHCELGFVCPHFH